MPLHLCKQTKAFEAEKRSSLLWSKLDAETVGVAVFRVSKENWTVWKPNPPSEKRPILQTEAK